MDPIDMKDVKVMVLTFRVPKQADVPSWLEDREDVPAEERADGIGNRLLDSAPAIGVLHLLPDMMAGGWGIDNAFKVERQGNPDGRQAPVYLFRIVLRPVADITPGRSLHNLPAEIGHLTDQSMWVLTVHRNEYHQGETVVPGSYALSVHLGCRTPLFENGQPIMTWVRKEKKKKPVKEEGKIPATPKHQMRMAEGVLQFEIVPDPVPVMVGVASAEVAAAE